MKWKGREKEYNEEYYQKHKEKIKERTKKYREEHPNMKYDYWRCVCNGLNSSTAHKCARCGRQKGAKK